MLNWLQSASGSFLVCAALCMPSSCSEQRSAISHLSEIFWCPACVLVVVGAWPLPSSKSAPGSSGQRRDPVNRFSTFYTSLRWNRDQCLARPQGPEPPENVWTWCYWKWIILAELLGAVVFQTSRAAGLYLAQLSCVYEKNKETGIKLPFHLREMVGRGENDCNILSRTGLVKRREIK